MENAETKTGVINKLLGYGAKFEFLMGLKEDGTEDVRTFHISPVPMNELPKLEELVNKFFVLSNTAMEETAAAVQATAKAIDEEKEQQQAPTHMWTEDMIELSSEILHMSLKKMHPDYTKEKCRETFTLGVLSMSIDYVMDVNDFFTGMEATMKKRLGEQPQSVT